MFIKLVNIFEFSQNIFWLKTYEFNKSTFWLKRGFRLEVLRKSEHFNPWLNRTFWTRSVLWVWLRNRVPVVVCGQLPLFLEPPRYSWWATSAALLTFVSIHQWSACASSTLLVFSICSSILSVETPSKISATLFVKRGLTWSSSRMQSLGEIHDPNPRITSEAPKNGSSTHEFSTELKNPRD